MDSPSTITITDDKLRQLEKLGALGTLAAGIAHEINTPIQFIGDNLVFLNDVFTTLLAHQKNPTLETSDELEMLMSEVPEAIEQAMEGVSRVATIVKAMKTFSHPDRAEMQYANIEEALRTTSIVARNEYKYIADLEFAFGGVTPVRCRVGDLQQVFLNLIVNAAHAMEDGMALGSKRGLIRVRTSQEPEWVLVEISDNGCGIPDDIRARIFEPFFTTKEAGRGTGQGLALVHSVVVDGHGGKLDVESTPGEGTTFLLRFPVAQASEEEK